MAVRNDISVDWAASPRVITVAAPSTELTVRDLQDTLRYLEMSDEGILHPHLRQCSGNDALGGGTSVALTLRLLNARVAFEARPGPAWVLCTISGGNVVAVDANGAPMEARHPTSYVSVDRAAAASGTVTVVETGGSALSQDEHDHLMGLANPDLANLDAAVSSRATPADLDVTVNPTLTQVEHDQLMGLENADLTGVARTSDLANLDAAVSSRATPADLQVTVDPTLTQEEHDQLMGLQNADLTGVARTSDLTPLASALLDLKDEAFGRWVMDFAANTLTLYRADGVTVLKRFNLTRSGAEPPVYVGRTPA